MKRLATILALLAVPALAGAGMTTRASAAGQAKYFRQVCGQVVPHHMRCMSVVQTDGHGTVLRFTNPSGYGPADLQSAYNLPSSTNGKGQTVALVDAYGYPTIQADLSAYRAQYGLSTCTTQNGCFSVVGQTGGPPPSGSNGGWDLEQALDVDMVSAVCPNCHIIMVESNTNNGNDLYAAENEAVKLGANAVSNSWGGGEYPGQTVDDQYFNHPGVAITASSGDSGYRAGAQYPAGSQYVTAVGGTTLRKGGGSRGWTETAWGGAGSGCSAYDPQPSWQGLADPVCPRGGIAGGTGRIIADVSAVADPSTGVAFYYNGSWGVVGGTSVASPIIASVYALAGNEGSITYGSYPYSHTSALYDITSGSNGSGCNPSFLCNAGTGYDGPTGLGTPNGIGAF
ncbi:MAG TPA: S53 family peptidase [Chloroflexota bacterium]|nr:S53 family peptidase [Chloroflexota bacterium]